MESKILVGMDIGTTKVCTVISKINEVNELEIIGVGLVPSRGLRKGVVINIETTAASIASSVEKAEIQAGIEVKGAYIGISGGHVEGITSKGVIAIADKNKEITDADVRRVIDAAMAIVIPVDREVVHVIPQEFIVDSQAGVKNPVGMSGIRLEAVVNIITAAASSINNVVKSVNRAGYETLDIILEPLAAAQAVLTEEEKELGVALLDIGGGTTDYIIFENGSTRRTGVISLGGNQITNDIAFVLKTPTNSAEELKKRYGAAISDYISEDEEIEIPGLGGRTPTIEKRKKLVEVIEARIEEIFEIVNLEFEKSGLKPYLPAGIVLTGGVALTPYISDLASEVFGLPVRIGKPIGIEGLKDIVESPIYSTAVGLALYAKNHLPRLGPVNTKDEDKNFKSIIDRIREWFNEFF
ncbi:MAG: cell division protein FtsA [Brevinematales bacterium]|nr:cell division protein FtsA [Brevinematales bacterium]